MSQNKNKPKPVQNNQTKKAPPPTTSTPQKEAAPKKYVLFDFALNFSLNLKCQYCSTEINNKEAICSRCRYNEFYEEDETEKNTKKKSISVSHASSTINGEKHTKEVSSSHVNTKDGFLELSKARIPLKNLVYVIGLAPEISKEEILSSYEYFGQYGKINKLVVNKNMPYNPTNQKGPSFSAYITYSNEREASMAIYAIDEIPYCNRILRASYGTTKYCINFLKNQECPNSECFYLHSFIKTETSYDKDQISNNKNIFADQQKIALSYLKKCFSEVLKIKPKNVETKLPNISEIINKLKEIKNEEKTLKDDGEERKEIPKNNNYSSNNNNDEKGIKSSKNNSNSTTAASSRTNKNKQPPPPHKEKILDIISLDEAPKNEKTSILEKNDEDKNHNGSSNSNNNNNHQNKKNAKNSEKKKIKNVENDEKDETNSLPEKSHDYYEFEENKNCDDNDDKDYLPPPLEIKANRKAESMYIDVSEVDKEIIKLFLSDKFGKTQNSRFSFANSKSSFDSKKTDEKCDMRKSMQEFLKYSLSPSYSPEKHPKNIETNGIYFEKFINQITFAGEIMIRPEEISMKNSQNDSHSKPATAENIKQINNDNPIKN